MAPAAGVDSSSSSTARRCEDTARFSREVNAEAGGHTEASRSERPVQLSRFKSALDFWRSKEKHAVLEHRKPRPALLGRNNTAPLMRHMQAETGHASSSNSPRPPRRSARAAAGRGASSSRSPGRQMPSSAQAEASPASSSRSPRPLLCSSAQAGVRPANSSNSPRPVVKRESKASHYFRVESLSTCSLIDSSVSPRLNDFFSDDEDACISDEPATTVVRPSRRSKSKSPVGVGSSLKAKVQQFENDLVERATPRVTSQTACGGPATGSKHLGAAQSSPSPVGTPATPGYLWRTVSMPASAGSKLSVAARSSLQASTPNLVAEPVNESSSHGDSMQDLRCSQWQEVEPRWQAALRNRTKSADAVPHRSSASEAALRSETKAAEPTRRSSASRAGKTEPFATDTRQDARAESMAKEPPPESVPLPKWPALQCESDGSDRDCNQNSENCSTVNLSLGWSRSYARLPGITGSTDS